MKTNIVRYRMDLDGKQHNATVSLMGVSFFLRIVYYFGFTRTEELGFGTLLVFLILPALLELAFVVMIRGIRLDAAAIYSMLGAAYCLLLLVQSFWYGNLVRTILAVPAYLLCGAALMLVIMGLLNRGIAAAIFWLIIAVRFLVFMMVPYIFKLHLISMLPELAALCGLFALIYLMQGFRDPKEQQNG